VAEKHSAIVLAEEQNMSLVRIKRFAIVVTEEQNISLVRNILLLW